MELPADIWKEILDYLTYVSLENAVEVFHFEKESHLKTYLPNVMFTEQDYVVYILSHVNKQLRNLCIAHLKMEERTKFDIYCNAIANSNSKVVDYLDGCNINYRMMLNIGASLETINNIIVRRNNIDVLKYYESKILNDHVRSHQKEPLSSDTLYIVISESHLEMVKYVFGSQYQKIVEECVCNIAAKRGVEYLRFVVDKGYPLFPLVVIKSIMSSDVNCVKYVLEETDALERKMCNIEKLITSFLLVRKDNPEILEYLMKLHYTYSHSQFIVTYGLTNCLKWLLTSDLKVEKNPHVLLETALKFFSIDSEIVTYLSSLCNDKA